MDLIWLQFSLALTLFVQQASVTASHYVLKTEKDINVRDYENDERAVIISKIESNEFVPNLLPYKLNDSRLGADNDGAFSQINDSDDAKRRGEERGSDESIYYLETPSKTDLSIGVVDNDGLTVGIRHRGGYIVIPDVRDLNKSAYRLDRLIKKFDSSENNDDYIEYEIEEPNKTRPKPKGENKPKPRKIKKKSRMTPKPSSAKSELIPKPKPKLTVTKKLIHVSKLGSMINERNRTEDLHLIKDSDTHTKKLDMKSLFTPILGR